MNLPQINMISQKELCEHIEDDDFLLRYIRRNPHY